MIIDIIFIKDGEKFQITGKQISNEKNIIKFEPLSVVLEDIASVISDLPIDDRTTPEPPPVGSIDKLTKIEMELWVAAYIGSWKKELADRCLEEFRQTFGIVVLPPVEET